MASQITTAYGTRKEEYTGSMISEVNVQKRQFQKQYMEYWNSTASITGTERPVDAVIAPLAPFAAARPDMYKYYGTSFFELAADFLFSSAGINLARGMSRLNVSCQLTPCGLICWIIRLRSYR